MEEKDEKWYTGRMVSGAPHAGHGNKINPIVPGRESGAIIKYPINPPLKEEQEFVLPEISAETLEGETMFDPEIDAEAQEILLRLRQLADPNRGIADYKAVDASTTPETGSQIDLPS